MERLLSLFAVVLDQWSEPPTDDLAYCFGLVRKLMCMTRGLSYV